MGFRVGDVWWESAHGDGHLGGQTHILTWDGVISEEINGVCERDGPTRREERGKKVSRAATVTRAPHSMKKEDAEEGISYNAAFSVASLSLQIPCLNMINCNKPSVKLVLPDYT